MKNKIKTLKRIFAAGLSSAMLFSSAYAAEIKLPHAADTGIELSLTNPVSNISVGDEAYARVELAAGGADELWGYEFEIEYDENYLTYTEADGGIDGESVSAAVEDSGRVKLAFSKTNEESGAKKVLATLKFKALRAGTATVRLKGAAVVDSDMAYEEFNNISDSVTINIKSNALSGGGSGGGGGFGGGGFSSGGTFSVGGGSNTVTASSQNLEPSDIEDPIVAPEIFNDLSGFEWAKPAIEKLYSMGVAAGYDDGGFHPGDMVTRAEFCKFATAALGIEPPTELEYKFGDVYADDWHAPYIAAAAELKIVNGYEDGNFRPDSGITREEAAAIICRAADALELPLKQMRLNINFIDESDIQEIFVGYVDELYTAGIINGDDDGNFRPADSLRRAETAQMLVNLLGALEPEPEPSVAPSEPAESAEPKAGRMINAAEVESSAAPEVSSEPADTANPSSKPDEDNPPVQTAVPNQTEEPIETIEPTESERPVSTEPPAQTEKPDETFREDASFDCASLGELCSYENIYAYEVPDDGSRSAFYDDFTTFQRPGAGGAYIAYRIPYAEKVRVESYFYAGEPLRDMSFETSKDGENFSAAEASCSYLEAEGKWTRAVYTINTSDDSPYIKIIYPETVNSWTPLVSRVSAQLGKARAAGIEISGETRPIIPMYDSAEYKYTANLADQIGEVYPGDVKLSIKQSDIPELSISEDGTITISGDMNEGAEFTLFAESGEFSAELNVKLTAALLGDLNLDGEVSRDDAVIAAARYGETSGSADWSDARDADINRDGKISVIDIAYISKKAADNDE